MHTRQRSVVQFYSAPTVQFLSALDIHLLGENIVPHYQLVLLAPVPRSSSLQLRHLCDLLQLVEHQHSAYAVCEHD